MAVYSVHTRGQGLDAIRDAVFVREGFSKAAFVFGILWLLRFRLWMSALIWLLIGTALVAASAFLTASASFALFVLFAVLTGLEANAARGRALARRGYTTCDVVAAADRDSAERRFFDRLAAEGPPVPPPRPAAQAARQTGTQVLGLFPEAEGRP